MQGSKRSLNEKETNFLNVDLDIYSRSKLDPLVAAFGKSMFVNYLGRERHLYSTHLEIAGITKSADAAIRSMCTVTRRLPRAERKLWDRAIKRDFNIGLTASTTAKCFEIALAARTIQMISSLNARIVVTVYSPEQNKSAR